MFAAVGVVVVSSTVGIVAHIPLPAVGWLRFRIQVSVYQGVLPTEAVFALGIVGIGRVLPVGTVFVNPWSDLGSEASHEATERSFETVLH